MFKINMSLMKRYIEMLLIDLFNAWKSMQQIKEVITEPSGDRSEYEKPTQCRIERIRLLRHALKIPVDKYFVLMSEFSIV